MMGPAAPADAGKVDEAPAPPGRLVYSRSEYVAVPPGDAFVPIRRIGGQRGWYYGDILWRVRGWMDLILGGPGMRGRRDPEWLAPGDTVDCFRVEAVEPGRRLELAVELRMPGRGWLTFEVEPEGRGSRITQTASFDPWGVRGLLYWYSMLPFHEVVFRGMLRAMAKGMPAAV